MATGLFADAEGDGGGCAELKPRTGAIASRLAAYVGACTATGASGLLIGDDGRVFVAAVAPAPLAGDAMVAVHLSPLRPAPWSKGDLMAVFGITPREADVVQGLTTGASLTAIADHLGLKATTVRQYLKLIYSKVGVDGRADLVARLSGAAGPHPNHGALPL